MNDKNRKAVYEVVSNSGSVPETIGHIWWTGSTIDSDIPQLIKELRNTLIADKKFDDGLDFFNMLPLHFRSGYLTIKRTK